MNDFIPLRKNLIKTHRELKKLFYMAKKSKNYNIALKIIESNRILREELTAADNWHELINNLLGGKK